jgi:hypothetical protein
MDRLAELLRQGADRLVELPNDARRFMTNPQAFTQLVTGKNPMPRETGFAAGATGLPAQEMSVLDPNQAPYMQGYSQGEPIGYAGMAAPFAAPAAVATAKALAPKLGQVTENYMVKQGMIQPLTAYHGTPHTIQGQFDINKVGTGEGAQAYGHGMYFAQNPAVAKEYQKMLQGPESTAQHYLDLYKTPESAISAIQYEIKPNLTAEAKKHSLDAIEVLKSGKELKGNLYKVDIPDADIPMMLNWDKPFKQQTQQVQDLLKPFMDENKLSANAKGVDIYQTLLNVQGKKPSALARGDDFYSGLQKDVSEQLNQLGVKGIRYLDEGSRKEGKGTSNFVVFEPSQVKILEQNNKPVTRKELIQEQIDKIE